MAERNIILVAGDDGENRKLLSEPLEDSYDIIEVEEKSSFFSFLRQFLTL